MSHKIDYSSQANSRDKAIQDIKDYVGIEKFEELDRQLQLYVVMESPTLEQFRMLLFMFPVSGYPIQAWYEQLCENVDE